MSIEWAMWFALGFLSAGILALLTMGAVWRRAVRLTTRRVTASQPAGLDEVRAEKDMLRAQSARDRRRFEMSLADMRCRNAEVRMAVGHARAETDGVRVRLLEEQAARAEGEGREAAQARVIDGHLVHIGELEVALRTAREHGADLEALRAALVADHAEQIDAHEAEAARARAAIQSLEARVVGLERDEEALRRQLAETAARLEAEKTAHGLARAASAQEKDRADRFDRRISRLVADVADREERIDRVARDLERARQALVFANARIAALGGEGDGTVAAGDNLLRSLTQLESRNRELEDRLASIDRDEAAAARADLKASLADFAARVVHLTQVAEAGSSTFDRIVAAVETEIGQGPSLAKRIRDLQKRVEVGG